MNTNFSKLLLVFFLLIFLAPQPALAIPVGLGPGDTFRYVFVTSTKTKAESSTIGDYDAFVTSAAASGTITGPTSVNWNAIVSTPSVGAATHIGSFLDDVYNTQDQFVTTGSAGLWSTSDTSLFTNPIKYDESGTTAYE